MNFEHVETTISGATIRMRLANHSDPLKATEWVELCVPTDRKLSLQNAYGQENPLGDLRSRRLAAIQLAVLRYVRDAISEETQRLASLPSS